GHPSAGGPIWMELLEDVDNVSRLRRRIGAKGAEVICAHAGGVDLTPIEFERPDAGLPVGPGGEGREVEHKTSAGSKQSMDRGHGIVLSLIRSEMKEAVNRRKDQTITWIERALFNVLLHPAHTHTLAISARPAECQH